MERISPNTSCSWFTTSTLNRNYWQGSLCLALETGGYAFALSRDGRFLAHSRDQQNELILEDISGPQPEQLQSMKLWLHGKFHWLSFSPDGRHLACATDENVIVLEVATFNTVWKWNAPGDIEWIEWAADGRHLVTLNSNQTAYVLRLNQLAPDVANVAT